MFSFEYAKKMELNSVRFYQEAAAWAPHIELRKILQLLSNEEEKHYNFLVALERDSEYGVMLPFPFKEAEKLFQQLCDVPKAVSSAGETSRRALGIENGKEIFYRNWVRKIREKKLQEQVGRLADEEQIHGVFMNELANYMMKCRTVPK